MIIDELIAILGYDVRGEGELARFNKGIDAAEKKARSASRALSAMSVAIGTFVGNLATQAFTRLSSSIGSLPGDVIKVGRTFENYRLQLETLEGSSAKAEEAMAWIKQFAKDTPLELADVIDSYASLKNFGIDPTNGSLMALVDTMAASGKGKEQLSGISLALGQAWAKEKLQGEEILQLVERGVPVWDLLSKATGKTSKQLQELSSKGKLGRETIQLLIDEMGKRYAGASEKFAKSFDGIVSKISDEWTEFLGNIAERGFYDEIKTRLEGVFETINRFRKDGTLDWLEEGFSKFLTGGVRAGAHIAQQIWDLGRGLYYAADGATNLVSRITGLGKGTSATLLGAGALASTAGGRRLLMGIAKRVPWVAALLAIDDIVTGLKGGDSAFTDIVGTKNIEELKTSFSDLKASIDDLFANTGISGFSKDLATVDGSLKSIQETAAKAFRQITEVIKAAKQAVDAANEMLFGADKPNEKATPGERSKPGYIEQEGAVVHMDGNWIIDRPDEKPTQDFTDDALDYKFRLMEEEGRRAEATSTDQNIDPVVERTTNNRVTDRTVNNVEKQSERIIERGVPVQSTEKVSERVVERIVPADVSSEPTGGSVIIDLLQSLKGKMEAAAASPHVAQLVENLQGNLARMEAANAAKAVEQTLNDNRQDNRNQSTTVEVGGVVVNGVQNVSAAVGSAVGNAVGNSAARSATPRISRAERDDAF